MGPLEKIIEEKFSEADTLNEPSMRRTIDRGLETAPPVRRFDLALIREDGNVAVVAELKRHSPSHGDIKPDLDVVETAMSYERGGASALSVLTDGPNFHGSLRDLQAARQVANVPVLRKDFTVSPVQVREARSAGADAVLLVVVTLRRDVRLLGEVQAAAWDLDMAAIVEVGNEDDLDMALEVGPRVIGINNRSFRDLSEGHDAVDLGTAERLISRVPKNVITIAMSGIGSTHDVQRMADAGFNAVLVGEQLVRSDDKQSAVRNLTTVPRTRTPEFV